MGENEEQIKDIKGFRSKQKEQTNDLVKKNVDMYLQNSWIKETCRFNWVNRGLYLQSRLRQTASVNLYYVT